MGAGAAVSIPANMSERTAMNVAAPLPGPSFQRFLHHAQVVAITGKSYRVKEAPAVTQENKKSRKTSEPATAGAAKLRLAASAPARFKWR